MAMSGGVEFVKYMAALVFVLALMWGLSLIMRRVNAGSGLMMKSQRRLRIIETIPLDHKRRLMLIRRDDREHLVILGATGETVVESGIAAHENISEDVIAPFGTPSENGQG